VLGDHIMSAKKIVITYGTFDCIHYGHIRLLQRAKSLGNYLIVGVTSDDFDKSRGKVNVQQSLMERIEGVRNTGLADKIIVEEYEGQKIDDIKRYDVTIFTVGSDWKGKFDYLKKYCEVIYLDRTEGISSTSIRSEERRIKIGLAGNTQESVFSKYINECQYVNGAEISGIFVKNIEPFIADGIQRFDSYDELLDNSDAVYIDSMPQKHYEDVRKALQENKHVICESPIALTESDCEELYSIASDKKLVLMDGIKTAYATAYNRLQLLVNSGAIGHVASISATCTRLLSEEKIINPYTWNSMCEWGPTALLPVFQIIGPAFRRESFITSRLPDSKNDIYTQIQILYDDASAIITVANGIKSESELLISGDKGYIYVPAPWWKTEYFEVRREDSNNNKRYFYQLEGEGIRYELVAFLKEIQTGRNQSYLSPDISKAIARTMENYFSDRNLTQIRNGVHEQ